MSEPIYLFDHQVTYSGDTVSPSPDLERFFSSSSSKPCAKLGDMTGNRQIYFRFHHDGACANILINPSDSLCLACSLSQHIFDIPLERSGIEDVFFYAVRTAAAAMQAAGPSDRVVYLDIYAMARWEEEYGEKVRVPADIRAVESLERKRVSPMDYFDGCAICLEEFIDGEEATVMPCVHVFHGDCITEWLERSHYCPLCRFELPAAVVDEEDK